MLARFGLGASTVATGSLVVRGGMAAVKGEEMMLSRGSSTRIAPFGNRTGHPTGKYPHYHRSTPDPSKAGQQPFAARWRIPWFTVERAELIPTEENREQQMVEQLRSYLEAVPESKLGVTKEWIRAASLPELTEIATRQLGLEQVS